MSRIPPPLHPYLSIPPETALILLTSTLGCTVNWLTATFAAAFLRPSQHQQGDLEADDNPPNDSDKPISVILISWLHDAAFWKAEISRTTRLDISKLSFHCISYLTHPTGSVQDLPDRLAALHPSTSTTILILDAPETSLFLPTPVCPTATQLSAALLACRSQVRATVVATTADEPLLSAIRRQTGAVVTPLEVDTAAFVTGQAHAAQRILSVRQLDTGAAKDVSGVLRVTRGGDADHDGLDAGEMEVLYLVQRDGNVKVFDRGAGS